MCPSKIVFNGGGSMNKIHEGALWFGVLSV
jgi:hypothetical protein